MMYNFYHEQMVTWDLSQEWSISPIPICTMVNLKYGYGGRMMEATIRPIKDPDKVARTTLKGMNHLHKERNIYLSTNYVSYLYFTKQQ